MKKLLLALGSAVCLQSGWASLPGPAGILCRQYKSQPRTLEIQRKSTGDFIVRISAHDLFYGQISKARTVELLLEEATCEPYVQRHWLDGNLMRCQPTEAPKIRDQNGELIEVPSLQRVVFFTQVEFGVFRNRLVYGLQLTTAQETLTESAQFWVDPSNIRDCQLR